MLVFYWNTSFRPSVLKAADILFILLLLLLLLLFFIFYFFSVFLLVRSDVLSRTKKIKKTNDIMYAVVAGVVVVLSSSV